VPAAPGTVAPGTVARASPRARSDGPDAPGLRIAVVLRAYPDAACTGAAIGAGATAEILTGTDERWRLLAPSPLVVPPAAVAVALELRGESAAGPRSLRFDDAALTVDADAIFANGLE
jgi:hypothetical protein